MSKTRHSNHNSLMKHAICIFLSFILAVCVTVIALFSCLKIGFMGFEPFSRALVDSHYYELRYDSFIKDAENEALISGLSTDLFDGMFSVNELQSQCNDYFQSIWRNERFEFDDTAITQTLSERIHAYVAEHNLEVDGDIEEVIASFSSAICEFYTKSLRFPFFESLSVLYQTFDKVIIIILPIMAALTLFLLFFLYALNKRKRNRAFRYIAYAFLSAAISVLILPIASYATHFYRKFLLTPEYVYRAFVAYYENGIGIFMVIGILCAILGILSMITSIMIKRKLIKKEKEHRKEHRSSYHHHHHEEESGSLNAEQEYSISRTNTSEKTDIDEDIKNNVEFF